AHVERLIAGRVRDVADDGVASFAHGSTPARLGKAPDPARNTERSSAFRRIRNSSTKSGSALSGQQPGGIARTALRIVACDTASTRPTASSRRAASEMAFAMKGSRATY